MGIDDDASAPIGVRPLAPDFLQGGGEMGALMRGFEWSTTPLGPPAEWPQPLRTAIRLILNTRHPMFAWLSLFGVALADFYVMLVAQGTIQNLYFF